MKKIFIPLVIAAGLLFSINSAFSQVEITTQNDNSYRGIVTYENMDTLKIVTLDRNTMTFSKKFLKSITICKLNIITDNGREYLGSVSKMDDLAYTLEIERGSTIKINKDEIKEIKIVNENEYSSDYSYSMVGVTLGTPAGIQAVFGYHTNTLLGVRVVGGTIGSAYGLQGNLLFNLSKKKNFEHNISLGVGYSYLETKEYKYFYYNDYNYINSSEWTYVGAFYDLNYYGFFLESGLTIGSGSFSNPQLFIQIGYVYRFWK